MVHGPSKFLERLADEKETDVVDIFGDLFRDAVKEASPHAGIKETDKQAIIQEVDTIVNTIKRKGSINARSMPFWMAIADRSFAVGQKRWWLGNWYKNRLSPSRRSSKHIAFCSDSTKPL